MLYWVAENGAKAYYHPDELFKNTSTNDLVAVCTPNGLHTEHSIAALLHGAHVLCEKPLSISAADGKRMIEVAEKTGKSFLWSNQPVIIRPSLPLKRRWLKTDWVNYTVFNSTVSGTAPPLIMQVAGGGPNWMEEPCSPSSVII